MSKRRIARAEVTVDAPIAKVWAALVDPEAIRQYMFGTNVESDFREGSPIVWRGEWEGKAYEDKGTIVRAVPEKTLQYTHFSPLAGVPDQPENYHKVTIDLTRNGDQTVVALAQDNNATEQEREHSEKNWAAMLGSLRQLLEKQG